MEGATAELQQLDQMLEEGLLPGPIHKLSELCARLLKESADPLPLFVLQTILGEIGAAWADRDRMMSVEESRAVRDQLLHALRDVLHGIIQQTPRDELWRHLNLLIEKYLQLSRA